MISLAPWPSFLPIFYQGYCHLSFSPCRLMQENILSAQYRMLTIISVKLPNLVFSGVVHFPAQILVRENTEESENFYSERIIMANIS